MSAEEIQKTLVDAKREIGDASDYFEEGRDCFLAALLAVERAMVALQHAYDALSGLQD
jgi:hypothetical protein